MYYLKTRYYDPKIGRFITIDDISYLAPDTINGLNLYAYCGNNPVVKVDPNGYSWKSFWKSVGNWFSNTFGAFVEVSRNVIKESYDYFFGGFEIGEDVGGTIGDNSKPISVYATNASELWKIWEYQVGIQIKLGDFSTSLSVGAGEVNFSVGIGDDAMQFQCGINKIGISASHTSVSITTYSQLYIRTVPMAILVLVAIFAPQLIPAAGALAFL